MPNLEEVFRLSGVPTYTFVTPSRYNEIKVSVRTPGRCLVLEGPSGIGKTTTISKVLEELEGFVHPVVLSARRPADIEYISSLPTLGPVGTVIVDDFHRLDDDAKHSLSDYMKVLADTEDTNTKLILIGINKAGQQLINFGTDVGLRIDIFRLEANSAEKVLEVVSKGEKALNVTISDREEVSSRSGGSFQIAQMLCHKLCVLSNVTETGEQTNIIDRSVDSTIEEVMTELNRQYSQPSMLFARGPKMKPTGRAPYLHLLKWLSSTDDGALDIREAMRSHPSMRGSVGQILDKGFLGRHLQDLDQKVSINDILFFDPSSALLGAEDPKYLFFLRNLVWRAFGRKCGYAGDYFKGRYDFALSFAGADRALAENLYKRLSDKDIEVFYDFAEQHKIAGADVEEYLAPIYRSEATYVLALLSKDYPTRIWTKIESDHFRDRFGEGAVVAIRYNDVTPGFFADDMKYGGIGFNPLADIDEQLDTIVEILEKKLADDREIAQAAELENDNDNEPYLSGLIS